MNVCRNCAMNAYSGTVSLSAAETPATSSATTSSSITIAQGRFPFLVGDQFWRDLMQFIRMRLATLLFVAVPFVTASGEDFKTKTELVTFGKDDALEPRQVTTRETVISPVPPPSVPIESSEIPMTPPVVVPLKTLTPTRRDRVELVLVDGQPVTVD